MTEEYRKREDQWDQQWPEATITSGSEEPLDNVTDDLDTSGAPDSMGTDDPLVATRDAEPYTPPIDPPVLPGGAEGIHVASGWATATDEASPSPLLHGDFDLEDAAVRALNQDSLTSHYQWEVHVARGVIHLHGRVPSQDDADHATWLLGELPGVVDVLDETTLDTTLA